MEQGISTDSPQHKHFHCPENNDFYHSGTYQSLDTDEFSIRLLKALPCDPSNPSGPLQFTLHQPVLLAKTVPNSPVSYPFIAMSYRAGDPFDTLPILVNGRTFNVFRSLGLGLRRLLGSLGRDKNDPALEEMLYLWADQICINQSDAAEKAIQVRTMCDIYEGCAWTYSWLGPDPDIDKGLAGMNRVEFVQKIVADALAGYGKAFRDISWAGGETYLWTVAALTKLESLEVDWACVKDFLNSEYWTRGWVCQEITVSPDVTYNTASVENDRAGLARAFQLLGMIRQCLRWDFELRGDELVPNGATAQAQDIDQMIAWAKELNWLSEMELGPFTFVLESSQRWKEIDGYPLDKLMLMARRSVVTDPLDKVYAFLGLALPGYNIVPNYSLVQTTANVFVEATVAWIQLHGALNILSSAEERTDELGPHLPSWVSDWNYPHEQMSLWNRWQGDPRRPRASGNYGSEPVFLAYEGQEDRVMEVSAVTVDTIQNVQRAVGKSVSLYDSWEHALAAWAKVAGLETERGFSEVNNASYPHLEGNSLAVAFWSTVFRGLKAPKFMGKLWRVLGKRHGGGEGAEREATGESAEEDSDEEGDGEARCTQDVAGEDNEREHVKGESVGEQGQDGGEEDQDEGEKYAALSKQDGDDADESTGDGDKKVDRKPSLLQDNGSGLAQHHLAMAATTDKSYLTKAGWHFIRSQKGYFALTRVNVQDGDIIMVLVGADMPFVLRPYLDGYKLMGEVYVHGIMHGELVKDFGDPKEVHIPAPRIRLY